MITWFSTGHDFGIVDHNKNVSPSVLKIRRLIGQKSRYFRTS